MYQTLTDTAKPGPRWIVTVLAIALLAQLPQTRAWTSQTVDYNRLNAQQQSLFAAYQQSHHGIQWADLTGSDQLEFAGASQALDTWWQYEPQAQPKPQPGAEQVAAVNEINGQIANASSEAQYNLKVKWRSGADIAFNRAWGWSEHIALLHPGMHGYQQNKNGNPFKGIVVLFDKNEASLGQFHIGFRMFGHYSADNGNIAKNYPSYCAWYGEIIGYVGCAATVAAAAFPAFWGGSR